MPSRRITIRRIKELLRLRYECRLSLERVARAQNLSKGVVAKYLKRAAATGIVWDEVRELDETELATRLQRSAQPRVSSFAAPEFAWIHQELKKKSVTLQLLWEEYRAQCAGRPYGYTSFCIHYRRWALQLKRSMRQVHRAGEKLFVDYAGQTVPVLDAITGELRQAQIFVAALGASSYTFACATWTQQSVDWIGSQVNALEFIGGCPECVVSDNPRALIANPDRYEPEVGRAYTEFATHYTIAILPARPRKPQDKAAVESAVGVVSRWILARLRHRQFFSLAELNAAVAGLLTDLNGRPFKKLPGSRRSAFESLDRPALRALPPTAFELAQWKKARVSIDYHVDFERHYYSVPNQLVRAEIELRITARVVECFHHGKRVASHARSTTPGYSTIAEHMPASHRAHREWSPGRLLHWGAARGSATLAVVRHLLESKPHPEQGYRACLGLMRLSRTYGEPRLEAACVRAVAIRALNYRSVNSILKSGLDRVDLPTPTASAELPLHENLRGPNYFH